MIFLFGLNVGVAMAQENSYTRPIIPNPTRFSNVEQIISLAGNMIRPVFVVAFALLLIYGAWIWIRAEGDDEKVKKAKQLIIAAIIGFSLAVLTPTILNFVTGIFSIGGALDVTQ